MIRLTNKNLWMAGALNHKRVAFRELDVPLRATWRGITAKASQILTDGERLVIIVSAAGPLRPLPSEHDVQNAQISALVFSKQPLANRYKTVSAFLRDDCGSQFHVDVDLTAIERRLARNVLRQRRGGSRNSVVPSPLVGFLLKQAEKFRF